MLKYYSVVGYTEDLQGFFNVLEAKFPTYFAGLPEIYHKYGRSTRQWLCLHSILSFQLHAILHKFTNNCHMPGLLFYNLLLFSGEYAAQRYKTKKKTPPNNSTKAIMIEKLHREYDFYYFIKQRFQNTLHLVNQSANRPK